jgi:hypothetical protein
MKLFSIGLLFSVPTLMLAQSTLLEPLTPEQKMKRRILQQVEPVSVISTALGASFSQLQHEPPQWGQGVEGYARRFGSAEGSVAAHNFIALGFDLAFHTDPRYRRMPEGRFMPRMRNAISQTFIANKDSGGKMVNFSEIGASFGAGFVANTWEPNGHNSTGNALTRGAVGLAYHMLKNVTREFMPHLTHP